MATITKRKTIHIEYPPDVNLILADTDIQITVKVKGLPADVDENEIMLERTQAIEVARDILKHFKVGLEDAKNTCTGPYDR